MNLTPEHIQRVNAKVAEICGWTTKQGELGTIFHVNPKDGVMHCWAPNYWQSLDACAEMEKTMTNAQWQDYDTKLWFITNNARPACYSCAATAPQRTATFLAVHNLTLEEI